MLLSVKFFINSLNQFWLFLKLQTRITLTVITVILILVVGLLYGIIILLQNFPILENNKFAIDISYLFGENFLFLMNENRNNDIIDLCERIYINTTTVKYILYINPKGFEYGIPYGSEELSFFYNLLFSNITFFSPLFVLTNFYSLDKINVLKFVTSNEVAYILLLVTDYTNPNFSLVTNFFVNNKIIALIAIFVVGIILTKIAFKYPLSEGSQGIINIVAGTFSGRIYFRPGGELGQLVGTFNELANRLQRYREDNIEQICNEKIKLESLITTINDGILLLDTNLNIVLVNEAAIRIFDWKTKTKLLGTSIWDHLPILLQKKLLITLQNVLYGEQNASFDGKIDNGATLFRKKLVRITLKIVYDSSEINNIPIGIGLTIQDRTKEFEFAKTQNRFISNISHELRTPLFNIKSFIETIQEYDYTLSNWQKKYFLNIVSKETNRLSRLVNDILFISKLDSRKKISMNKVDLTEIIQQTLATYQIIAHDKNLNLYLESHFKELYVYGNKDLLLQVFINLVGNALKFTYKQGEIVIRVYALSNKLARIEIFDTGIGIMDTYQSYIFQRFYRIENEVHTLKGTGLGLSIVNNILLEHKTNIQVISRYKIGSLFWFDIRRV